ncbi:MAG: sulfatase-like hydrolase/transferase, partial [Planctomycetales bacterium]|nr:sulfatase-like hydrolase/transferase [Planctomycetales bacterium]
FMTGKWHLSGTDQADWPLQRGFDRYYGCLSGATHFFHPYDWRIIYDGNTPVDTPESTTDRPFYTTDAFADHAIRFIDEHEAGPSKEKPFFLYLAFTAPHWPHHAHDQELEKYRGKFDMGWDKLREQRFARQKASGLIPSSWKLSPRDPEVPDWDSLGDRQKKECSFRMGAYAAMIDRVDQNVGKLVAFLREREVLDDTLILFLSDNGASAEIMVRGDGHDPQAARGSAESYLCLGPGWSTTANTPFRRHKTWVHEGGISTPLIAHWPARIDDGGALRRTPGHVVDIVPTVLELAGVAAVADLPGRSLVPAFTDDVAIARDSLWWSHEGHRALRQG